MCTIFKATQNGVTLVGNNEDYSDSNTKVWFLASQDGKYGRVYFGYFNGWAQGGMNEHGLFFDWVSGYEEEWLSSPDKYNFAGNLSEKIMEEASLLAQVVVMYEQYNEPSFTSAKVMYVDHAGASAVIGFENGQLHIDYGKSHQTLGYAYHTANSVLCELHSQSKSTFESLLQSCLQTGENPTQYSNIYDLSKREVYVYDFHESTQCFKFNLMEELQRGNHCYNLHQLASQLEGPLIQDYKTKAAELAQLTFTDEFLNVFEGTYELNKELQFTIKADKGTLYAAVNTPPNAVLLRLIQGRGKKSEWYAPSHDAKFTFVKSSSGQYERLILQGGITSDNTGESRELLLYKWSR
ncbi:hypothetical protein [Paenibacillus radicis (ex Gao et al. 2016)]|uniref:Linear amide C-N hydrolase n=1 Tax=Paenibacillus radicis (ex Gao et al. 2016) TaxID=1737354 RepID=A0A917H277_9BACL|nr:hypothetical protein [Paenibacillus radicis (ex Gao et al. 2016)]GGG64549.1 hypothetical protein GCM10010918_18300 [Paenibacillus radicis (ex Gao et al. 2016)]